jgi:DNA-binding transcriptional MerR regulator
VSYSVGQVADLAGVTIRTLHHYDEIGLLSPSGRSAAGYRIYEEPDLERLQRILFYRELGFALEEISTIVDDPHTDPVRHLRRQRRLLIGKIKRLRKMVATIDYELEAREMDIKLTPEERLEVFGDFNPEDHAEEAERRWGGTVAHKERTGPSRAHLYVPREHAVPDCCPCGQLLPSNFGLREVLLQPALLLKDEELGVADARLVRNGHVVPGATRSSTGAA